MARRLVSFRDAQRTLIANGFVLDRINGGHYHYVRNGARAIIPIRLNREVWLRTIKENHLEV